MEKQFPQQFDIVVVGAGIAGTVAALELTRRFPDSKIALLNKGQLQDANSYYAKGGIAAVVRKNSTEIEQHIEDTLRAGHDQNDPKVVREVCENAHLTLLKLRSFGVQFDPDLHLEGGHRTRRIYHISDATGKYIMRRLHEKLSEYPNISHFDRCRVLDLQRCTAGFELLLKFGNSLHSLKAGSVVLAGGGMGNLFHYSSNGGHATGELHGMAIALGAKPRNISVIQFHPTLFYSAKNTNSSFLITEALRGEGAILRNPKGVAFMEEYHELADLAPRDVVTQAIRAQMKMANAPHVWLDATHFGQEKWEHQFSHLYEELKKAGINPVSEQIPVAPGAHYSCGGIATSTAGETSVNGLFVIGEMADTGLHGNNRLASNSLTEAVWMGMQVAKKVELIPTTENEPCYNQKFDNTSHAGDLNRLRDVMQRAYSTEVNANDLADLIIELKEYRSQYPFDYSGICVQEVLLELVAKITSGKKAVLY